ncbi:DUF433 domain-containing protein [Nocardia sp. NPDC088792]|uniref:DUF433 domain-containing protein n=1 Tax=Nocardia sp. NPDC088792 TaxID=3364332 RepID=UPI0038222984
MSFLHRITLEPGVCHGQPIIQGTRYPVALLVDLLRAGVTADEVLTDCPGLTREDLVAAMMYATLLTTPEKNRAATGFDCGPADHPTSVGSPSELRR